MAAGPGPGRVDPWVEWSECAGRRCRIRRCRVEVRLVALSAEAALPPVADFPLLVDGVSLAFDASRSVIPAGLVGVVDGVVP